MTAHTTLTTTRWTCTAGHDTWARTQPERCPHCVGGRPCDGTITDTKPGAK